MIVWEKAGHSDWKNLKPSSSTSVVVFCPGSTIAGAGEREGGRVYVNMTIDNLEISTVYTLSMMYG